MNSNALISVIIPAYHVEKYIDRTLRSLQAQTLPAWVALCVDDGSRDATGLHLDEFSRKDDRIRVVHQPNRGVSTARNRALDRVTTDYFMFVDSDDWVEVDHLEHLYHLTHQHHATIGVVNAIVDAERGGGTHQRSHDPYDGVLPPTCPRLLRGPLWNKLYQSRALRAVRFAKHLYHGEDIVYLLMLAPNVKTMAFDLKYAGYHYKTYGGSLSHSNNYRKDISAHWDDVCYLENYCKTIGDFNVLRGFLIFMGYLFFKAKSFGDVWHTIRLLGRQPKLWKLALTPSSYEGEYSCGKHERRLYRIFASPVPCMIRAFLFWGYLKLLVVYPFFKRLLLSILRKSK